MYQPDLTGNEKDYVLQCLDSTWISSKGRFIAEFESSFATFVGTPHAASVCNGTVALHLALLAIGVGPGDEVIVPSFTYVASVNAIRYVGAIPVFCDSRPDTWQMDPDDLVGRIGPKTKAVMAVHLYGGACDMARLAEICQRHNLKLVEDCAEAIGTRIQNHHVGTFGDVATFSFFGNKTITTGEGGMVVSPKKETDAVIRHLRGQGLAANREYWHDIVGYNYRMTNLCAAIGLAQLERVDSILSAKASLAHRYQAALDATPLAFQSCLGDEESPSYWMVTVLTPEAADRDPLRAALSEAGVETRPAFYPVHTMPMYHDESLRLPVAESIASRGINLPSWHRIPDASLTEICDAICGYWRARQ